MNKIRDWFKDLKWLDEGDWALFVLNVILIVTALVSFMASLSLVFLGIFVAAVWVLIYYVNGTVKINKQLHKAKEEFNQALKDFRKKYGED